MNEMLERVADVVFRAQRDKANIYDAAREIFAVMGLREGSQPDRAETFLRLRAKRKSPARRARHDAIVPTASQE